MWSLHALGLLGLVGAVHGQHDIDGPLRPRRLRGLRDEAPGLRDEAPELKEQRQDDEQKVVVADVDAAGEGEPMAEHRLLSSATSMDHKDFLYFFDDDPRVNQIGGVLHTYIQSRDMTDMYVLWGVDDECNRVEGEPPLSTWEFPWAEFPTCQGNICNQTSMEYTGETRWKVRISHWFDAPGTSYGNNEQAEFNITGPARLTLIEFDTEPGKDFLTFPGILGRTDELSGGYQWRHTNIGDETFTMRWSTDGTTTGSGFIVDIEYTDFSPGAILTNYREMIIPNGTMIPAGAASIMVLEDRFGSCKSWPLKDFAPPDEVAMHVHFVDEDKGHLAIGGTMTITRMLPLPNLEGQEFWVFVGNLSTGEVGEKPIAKGSANSDDRVVQVAIPYGTTFIGMDLLVYSVNATGQAETPYVLEVEDVHMPEAFNFTDIDPDWNTIGGNLSLFFEAAQSVKLRYGWDLVWGSDESCNGLEGEAPILSLDARLPPVPCEDTQGQLICNDVTQEYIADNAARVSGWRPFLRRRSWADLTITGPANVTFTQFEAPEAYGFSRHSSGLIEFQEKYYGPKFENGPPLFTKFRIAEDDVELLRSSVSILIATVKFFSERNRSPDWKS